MKNKIVEEAISWVGTPYHSGANIKGVGVDCGQILIEIFGNVGVIDKFNVEAYPMDWALHRSEEKYLEFIEKYCDRVEKWQQGDIVLYKFGRCVSHSGVFIDDKGTIVHALVDVGVIYSNYLEGNLGRRVYGFYRVREN
jgi:cell wall-associated NlpC family hydrolase